MRVAAAVLVTVLLAGCRTAGTFQDLRLQTRAAPVAAAKPIGFAAGDAGVVIAPNVLDGWNFLYRFIDETEFALCLEGSSRDGAIQVTGFRLARMRASESTFVAYEPCDVPNYLGVAHNHPPGAGAKNACHSLATRPA